MDPVIQTDPPKTQAAITRLMPIDG